MKARTVFSFVLIAILLSTFVIGPSQASAQITLDHTVYLPAVRLPFAAGPELNKAYAGAYRGRTVTMMGSIAGVEEANLNASVQQFEQATGIDIQYTGSGDFWTAIVDLVDQGIPPDIADFSMPGLLADFARQGKVLDLNQVINPAWLKQNYKQTWLDLATMPGPSAPVMAGIFTRVNDKDVVWYPKAAFDAAGYQVPQTWDDLMALTAQIAGDGITPWCIGIESGAATGWVATDWIEALMLRTTSLQNYDNWVNGTLKFNSPEVRNAISYMTDIWFKDSYVYGGQASIATTNIISAIMPMFDNPPKCFLHKSANFITSYMPSGLVPGVDYDAFYLPPVDPAYGQPFVGAGSLYAAFNDRPEVRAAIQYFSTGDSVKTWVQAGGIIAVQNDARLDWYPDPVSKKIAQMMQQATSFRIDASDLMPSAVGAGSFWSQITAYVKGDISLDTALANIDASWTAGSVGAELAQAYQGAYRGTTVTMMGSITGVEETNFNASVQQFEQMTGIDIQYTGSSNFDTEIENLVDSGTPPDIADFPSPGLLADFARQGKVLDLNQVINPAWLKQNYKQAWLDLATMPGPSAPIMAGIFTRAGSKDLVWYPKAAFDAAGYQVPQTWDELMALTAQIAGDGTTPWCIGIESGYATGWIATDWIEGIMLRTSSLQNYDNWVNGTLKFDSPEIRSAIGKMTDIWFSNSYVYGGRASIATTNFISAIMPMFDNPPKCYLHKSANFITSYMPSGLVPGVDYDAFYLPPIDPAYGQPFEIGGDIYAAFNDRPEVRAAIQYFSTGDSVKTWVQAGGVIAVHNDARPEWYPDPVSKKIAQMMQQATSFRFDASDLMPPEVGFDSFWSQITAFVKGDIDLNTTLANIDASWP